MKRIALIFLLLCSILFSAGCDTASDRSTTTTAVTTDTPIETIPLWEKTEFYEGDTNEWKTADSMEALSDLLAEYMTKKISQGSDKLSITFQMNGYVEVTEPFEEAFGAIANKEINAWNNDRDPYVHTKVTLRYEDVDPETIWNLAKDEKILLVQIQALNVGWASND